MYRFAPLTVALVNAIPYVVKVKGEGEGMAVKCCNFESLLSCIIFTVIVTFVEVTIRSMGSSGIVGPTG